jgi:deoxyribonuclease-4
MIENRTPDVTPGLHLGAHMSIAGGFEQAAERARQVGATALQVFVKSTNQWRARALAAGEGERFLDACRRAGIERVVAHDSYLINMCSGNPVLWKRSVDAMAEEMERCDTLGIPALVAHPGAHGGDGEEAGLERLVRALDLLAERLPHARVRILLETTAGQGTALGHRFEHLRHVLERVRRPERVGVCLDTCHVFAAGYDLRTAAAYAQTLAEFDRVVGLARLGAVHLNDSKKDLGSRVDRHEHIGKGCLGLEAFRCLVNDPRLRGLPMVLETPKGDDLREDVENLERLRALLTGAPARGSKAQVSLAVKRPARLSGGK